MRGRPSRKAKGQAEAPEGETSVAPFSGLLGEQEATQAAHETAIYVDDEERGEVRKIAEADGSTRGEHDHRADEQSGRDESPDNEGYQAGGAENEEA